MILVSVCMISYNQADFILMALEGVLSQICDFEIEVILSNDSSNDNSDLLICNLLNSHPNGGLVKYFSQESNLGMNQNLKFALDNCSGKYIAVCEGDDYWTDPLKLQKQVDFLEAHSNFSLCFHSVNVLFPDGTMIKDYIVNDVLNQPESTIYDLAALGNYIHTPSVVFRKSFDKLPDSFIESPIGDYYLWICVAQFGKIKKLNETMAVYRIGVGHFSSKSRIERLCRYLEALNLICKSIEDKTVTRILMNQRDALEYSLWPNYLKSFKGSYEFLTPAFLSENVSIRLLIKAIFKKLKRRIY